METYRHGTEGAAHEIQLSLKPWGFNIADIKCPVTIWHGGLDNQAPAKHAEVYAKLIPNAKLTFFQQEGHISILTNKFEEISRSITVSPIQTGH